MSARRRWTGRARGAAIVVASVFAAAFTSLITLAAVLPDQVLLLTTDMPLGGSAQARAIRAQATLDYALLPENADNRREWLDETIFYARSALAQEPGNVEAARTLALAYDALRQRAKADRLLHYANGLSRRDGQTEMALGERAQAAGKADLAMTHYGHALRTSENLDAVLARLAAAETDTRLQDAIGRSLAGGPRWKSLLLGSYAARTKSAPSLYRISAAAWREGLPAGDRRLASAVLGRLVALQAPEETARLYDLLVPGGSEASRLTDGGFERMDGIPPFAWRFTGSGRVTASPKAGPSASGTVLGLRARSAARGTVASQTLMLAPGPYRLAFHAGELAPELAARPALRVTCLRGSSKRSLAPLVEVQATPRAEVQSGDFAVPAACPFQLLEVRFGAPATMTEAASWIDDVAIARR